MLKKKHSAEASFRKCLTDELNGALKKTNQKKKKLISMIISGELLKKYRMTKCVGGSITRQGFYTKDSKKVQARETLRRRVIEFLKKRKTIVV